MNDLSLPWDERVRQEGLRCMAVMLPTLRWFVSDVPVPTFVVERAVMARAKGQWAPNLGWDTLLHEGMLQECRLGDSPAVVIPAATAAAITPAEQAEAEQQRAIQTAVRTAWVTRATHRAFISDLTALDAEITHLTHYRAITQRLGVRQTAGERDLALVLAEALARRGQGAAASALFGELPMPQGKTAHDAERLARYHYTRALIGLALGDVMMARGGFIAADAALVLPGSQVSLEDRMAHEVLANQMQAMSLEQLQGYRSRGWFMDHEVRRVQAMDRELERVWQTGSRRKPLPPEMGLTIPAMTALVCECVPSVSPLMARVFVVRELVAGHLGVISRQAEPRSTPAQCAHWLEATFAPPSPAPSTYQGEAVALRRVMRVLRWAREWALLDADEVYVAGGVEALPFLYVQWGPLVLRLYGQRSGQAAWATKWAGCMGELGELGGVGGRHGAYTQSVDAGWGCRRASGAACRQGAFGAARARGAAPELSFPVSATGYPAAAIEGAIV